MSNQIEVTNEQALKILLEVAALPILKLSLQEHATVQAALERVRVSFVELEALKAPKPAELTVVPDVSTIHQSGGITAQTVNVTP